MYIVCIKKKKKSDFGDPSDQAPPPLVVGPYKKIEVADRSCINMDR